MSKSTSSGFPIFSGCICQRVSCNLDLAKAISPETGCAGKGDYCFCFKVEGCLKTGVDQFKPGFETGVDGTLARLALPCCTCGVKVPTNCMDIGGNCLCLNGDVAFPPTDERPLTCGVCFVSCILKDGVKVGVFKTFDELVASEGQKVPTKEDMNRS